MCAAAGTPQDVPAGIGCSGENEEQIREPVQVSKGFPVDPVCIDCTQRPGTTFGAAGHRARLVQQRGAWRPTGQDEAVQLGQRRVEFVAPFFESSDLVRRDPQCGPPRLRDHRCAQISADVEQVVLHLLQYVDDLPWQVAQRDRHPDCGVGFVAVCEGRDARIGLGDAGHVTERSRPIVTGLGIDTGEVDSHVAHASLCGMQVFRVTGGARLQGEVSVVGAKNSVLKLMAAALLAPGQTTLRNLPAISDVTIMHELLSRLGCEVHEAAENAAETADSVRITVPDDPAHVLSEAPYDLVRRIRGSICVLGPLLARTGHANVALPGGDAIGSRPLDMHFAGLERMGAHIGVEHGYIVAEADRLHGSTIWLDFPSVGATENILMAAVLAKGSTVIDNVAREPEIVDLCRMLVAMGAQIDGIGSSTLEIDGVDALRPTTHVAVADRIVAGTWAFAATATRGDVTIRGGRAEHLEIALDKLVRSGADIELVADGFRIRMDQRPKSFDVVTLPYPGLATDLQPQAIALLSIADGTALITENLFEGRFMFCDEIARMDAEVRTDGHHAVVRGKPRLSGAPVRATDIRAGAGLVIAGLVAEGVTEISDIEHIDRGYVRLEDQLRSLGADVQRVDCDAL